MAAASDEPLFDFTGLDLPAGQPKKPRRSAPNAPRTPDEYAVTAQEIVGQWCDIVQQNSGVPYPEQIVARIGAGVKDLIESEYTYKVIMLALWAWSVEKNKRPDYSPTHLADKAFAIARSSSPRARAWSAGLESSFLAAARAAGVEVGPRSRHDAAVQRLLRPREAPSAPSASDMLPGGRSSRRAIAGPPDAAMYPGRDGGGSHAR